MAGSRWLPSDGGMQAGIETGEKGVGDRTTNQSINQSTNPRETYVKVNGPLRPAPSGVFSDMV